MQGDDVRLKVNGNRTFVRVVRRRATGGHPCDIKITHTFGG